MNHLEENALKKFDNIGGESNEKGVKFEIMEEIIGSMKHKSTVFEKIESLKLKRQALEFERVHILSETDYNVLSGFMPKTHEILSPTNVHEHSKEDSIKRYKEHHAMNSQV